jgi:hypothetical protein
MDGPFLKIAVNKPYLPNEQKKNNISDSAYELFILCDCSNKGAVTTER